MKSPIALPIKRLFKAVLKVFETVAASGRSMKPNPLTVTYNKKKIHFYYAVTTIITYDT